MLVVTRVDENGAAYTVTNLDRGEGFKITKEKLYHPERDGEGLFYELTGPSRGMLGMIGNGGFATVRRSAGLDSLPAYHQQLDHYLGLGVQWTVLVKEIGTSNILFESLQDIKFHPVSMIKIALAIVALMLLDAACIQISEFYNYGYDGRSFEQLIYAMVVESEELASSNLLKYIQANGNKTRILNEWGLLDTLLKPRTTTVYNLTARLEGLFTHQFLNQDMSKYLLELMLIDTDNDPFYLGSITSLLPRLYFQLPTFNDHHMFLIPPPA